MADKVIFGSTGGPLFFKKENGSLAISLHKAIWSGRNAPPNFPGSQGLQKSQKPAARFLWLNAQP